MIEEERNRAWVEWNDFDHGQYYPRFYRHRVGGKRAHINPFDSMTELNEAREIRVSLARKYYDLNLECYRLGLPRLPKDLVPLWIEEETPNGRRSRRIK